MFKKKSYFLVLLEKAAKRIFGAREKEKSTLDLFLETMAQYPPLSKEKEREFIKKSQEGDEDAREKILNHNLRLVYSIAKPILTQNADKGFEITDLINEGIPGLMKALDQFDLNAAGEDGEPLKFSTFASYWIKQSIQRALGDKGDLVRKPIHVGDKVKQLLRLQKTLYTELGRKPTNEELALRMGMSESEIAKLLERNAPLRHLDAPIGEEGETSAGDLFPSPAESPEQSAMRNLEVDLLNKLMEVLTPREHEVMTFRWGLGANEQQTLEQIGDRLDLTKEAVRLIEKNSLEKLKKAYRDMQKRKKKSYLQVILEKTAVRF